MLGADQILELSGEFRNGEIHFIVNWYKGVVFAISLYVLCAGN